MRKKKVKRLQSFWLISLVLLLGMTFQSPASVWAEDAAADEITTDSGQTAEITVHDAHGQGFSYSIYLLGTFDEDEELSCDPAYEDLLRQRENASSSKLERLAEKLAEQLEEDNVSATVADLETDENGIARFSDLTPGCYLITAKSFTTSEGKYFSATPTLVTVPGDEGEDIYSVFVEASSKLLTSAAERMETTNSSSGILPQTGILWWPVPILAGCGIFLYLLGYIIERRQRRVS